MDINELKQSLDIIFQGVPDGEVSGNVYGYHDQVEIYPGIVLDKEQIDRLEKLGWKNLAGCPLTMMTDGCFLPNPTTQ